MSLPSTNVTVQEIAALLACADAPETKEAIRLKVSQLLDFGTQVLLTLRRIEEREERRARQARRRQKKKEASSVEGVGRREDVEGDEKARSEEKKTPVSALYMDYGNRPCGCEQFRRMGDCWCDDTCGAYGGCRECC